MRRFYHHLFGCPISSNLVYYELFTLKDRGLPAACHQQDSTASYSFRLCRNLHQLCYLFFFQLIMFQFSFCSLWTLLLFTIGDVYFIWIYNIFVGFIYGFVTFYFYLIFLYGNILLHTYEIQVLSSLEFSNSRQQQSKLNAIGNVNAFESCVLFGDVGNNSIMSFVNSDEFALLFGLNCINICLPNVM